MVSGQWTLRQARWPMAVGLTGILVLAVIVTFWETAESLIGVWSGSRTFNHGFFIPLIVLWLTWSKREAVTALSPQPSILGLALMAGAGLVWFLGNIASVQVAQHFALVVAIQASVLAVLGWRVVWRLFFPLAYLFFAVPFGEFLIGPLQDFTAHFVVYFLRLMDIPVFSDGVFISIPTGNFEVAEACAGLRFLIATVAIGVLFAHLFYRSWPRRLVFVGLSIAVPIIANGFRALGIVLLAYYTNNRLAVGVDHIVYGFGFFAFILIVLLFAGSRFSDKPVGVDLPPSQGGGRGASSYGLASFAALALLVAALAPAYANYIDMRHALVFAELSPPRPGDGWRPMPTGENPLGWRPAFTGVDQEYLRAYRKDDAIATLYIGFYATQRQGAELIHRANTVVGGDGWRAAARGVRSLPNMGRAGYVRMTGNAETVSVYYWYWVDEQMTASAFWAKVLHAKSLLLGGTQEAAVVAVAVGDAPREEARAAQVAAFRRALGPISKIFPDPVSDGAAAP